MKIIAAHIIFLLLSFGAKAQHAETPSGTQGIWLTNSDQTTIKEEGDTVNRAFFAADKVYIGSNNPALKKEDRYYVIIHGKTVQAHSEASPLLSQKLKQQIQEEQPGTRLVFTRMASGVSKSIVVILQ